MFSPRVTEAVEAGGAGRKPPRRTSDLHPGPTFPPPGRGIPGRNEHRAPQAPGNALPGLISIPGQTRCATCAERHRESRRRSNAGRRAAAKQPQSPLLPGHPPNRSPVRRCLMLATAPIRSGHPVTTGTTSRLTQQTTPAAHTARRRPTSTPPAPSRQEPPDTNPDANPPRFKPPPGNPGPPGPHHPPRT